MTSEEYAKIRPKLTKGVVIAGSQKATTGSLITFCGRVHEVDDERIHIIKRENGDITGVDIKRIIHIEILDIWMFIYLMQQALNNALFLNYKTGFLSFKDQAP